MYSLIIEKIIENKDMPFDLLLLADETLEAIEKYLYTSDVYITKHENIVIAAFVLQPLNNEEVEIKNIAVAEHFQGKGIGSMLIERIKDIVKESGYVRLWVGTADCGVNEIAFYKKNGFEAAGIKKDFFIINYSKPIYDNGVMLRDMVMFNMQL